MKLNVINVYKLPNFQTTCEQVHDLRGNIRRFNSNELKDIKPPE